MGSCESSCFVFPPTSVTSISSYGTCNVGTPSPLVLVLTPTTVLNTFIVSVQGIDLVSVYTPNNINFTLTSLVSGGGISLGLPSGNMLFSITLNGPIAGLDSTSYKAGDIYAFWTGGSCGFQAYVYFTRNKTQSISASPTQITPTQITPVQPLPCPSCSGCQIITTNTCGNVRVPAILILAQTTVDGSDIGDVLFTICDKITYYKETPLPPEDKCVVVYATPDQIKQTTFRRCCPSIVSVLRGKGDTAHDKALSIYNRYESRIGTTFLIFTENLMLYSMAKYVLSRILYGNWNIDYILGKFNDKFLKDLGNSRFCEFLILFEDCQISPVYGYNKYFKYNH